MGRADTNGNGLAAVAHAHPGIPHEAPGSHAQESILNGKTTPRNIPLSAPFAHVFWEWSTFGVAAVAGR